MEKNYLTVGVRTGLTENYTFSDRIINHFNISFKYDPFQKKTYVEKSPILTSIQEKIKNNNLTLIKVDKSNTIIIPTREYQKMYSFIESVLTEIRKTSARDFKTETKPVVHQPFLH